MEDILDLLKQVAVEDMNTSDAPVHFNSEEANAWLQGFQLGYQIAIEFKKQNNN